MWTSRCAWSAWSRRRNEISVDHHAVGVLVPCRPVTRRVGVLEDPDVVVLEPHAVVIGVRRDGIELTGILRDDAPPDRTPPACIPGPNGHERRRQGVIGGHARRSPAVDRGC
jgi:hypothetical protein